MDFFDYVRIYDIEDNELCDSLIRKYADQEWEQHSWGHNDGTTQHQEPDYAEILNPAPLAIAAPASSLTAALSFY